MKLVIDCNVFVSAALGSKACQQVIEKAVLHCDIFYSDDILREISDTFLKPKLRHAEAEGQCLLKQLEVIGIRVDPQPCHICLPDPDDEIYLSVAIYAKADAVITGNIKHFPHKKCRNIRILTPRNFLNEDAFAS